MAKVLTGQVSNEFTDFTGVGRTAASAMQTTVVTFAIVQKHAIKNGVKKVHVVNLEIGALSDLQNEWIQRYFDYLSKGSPHPRRLWKIFHHLGMLLGEIFFEQRMGRRSYNFV